MDMFTEAGIGAVISLALFVVGLVTAARGGGRPDALAGAIVAVGAIGTGLGQRLVARAAEAAPTLGDKVEILAVGTREATANLVVAGTLALVLIVVAAVSARMNATPKA